MLRSSNVASSTTQRSCRSSRSENYAVDDPLLLLLPPASSSAASSSPSSASTSSSASASSSSPLTIAAATPPTTAVVVVVAEPSSAEAVLPRIPSCTAAAKLTALAATITTATAAAVRALTAARAPTAAGREATKAAIAQPAAIREATAEATAATAAAEAQAPTAAVAEAPTAAAPAAAVVSAAPVAAAAAPGASASAAATATAATAAAAATATATAAAAATAPAAASPVPPPPPLPLSPAAAGGGGAAAGGSISCACCRVLGGAVAGSIAKTLVYPLDRLKIHMQVKAAAAGCPFRLRDAPGAFREMAKREGALRGLWKGNACAFIRTFPYSGLSFYSFDMYNGLLQQQVVPHISSTFARLLAGAAAGMTATTLTYPLDVLNTRMALTHHRLRYHQVSLLNVEGWRSLYRGLGPTALGIVPYAGISFCTYETLKEKIQAARSSRKSSSTNSSSSTTTTITSTTNTTNTTSSSTDPPFNPLWSALCGGIAGVTGQMASYPLDTLRKYMQAHTFLYRFQESGHTGSAGPLSMGRALRFLWSRGGLRGLYNGVSLNWVKGFLAAGVAFSLNETGKLMAQSTPTNIPFFPPQKRLRKEENEKKKQENANEQEASATGGTTTTTPAARALVVEVVGAPLDIISNGPPLPPLPPPPPLSSSGVRTQLSGGPCVVTPLPPAHAVDSTTSLLLFPSLILRSCVKGHTTRLPSS